MNALRGLLYEFGVVLPQGRHAGLKALREQRARIDAQLPQPMQRLVDLQLQALHEVEQHIVQFEAQIAAQHKQLHNSARLDRVPGIGLLGATALAATLGDGSGWRSGREFSACLGLVPEHSGTGGKTRVGHLSKRGEPGPSRHHRDKNQQDCHPKLDQQSGSGSHVKLRTDDPPSAPGQRQPQAQQRETARSFL